MAHGIGFQLMNSPVLQGSMVSLVVVVSEAAIVVVIAVARLTTTNGLSNISLFKKMISFHQRQGLLQFPQYLLYTKTVSFKCRTPLVS